MDNAGYTTLTRQAGLLREMQIVANNIANISTTGYRREGLIFAEFVAAGSDGEPSLSMANANVRSTDERNGPLRATGNPLDLAIEGPGWFQLETPQGNMLTRAGNFTANSESELVSQDGYRVLDAGGAPIFLPPDAENLAVAPDGTVSADGRPIAAIGIVDTASGPGERRGGSLFASPAEVIPAEDARVLQGFVEDSNVNPVLEIARMIEVQHAYELGQTLADQEDERIRSVMRSLSR